MSKITLGQAAITAKVVNEQNESVSAALVSLQGISNSHTTDSNGILMLKDLIVREYQLTVTASGYLKLHTTAFLKPGLNQLHIILKKDTSSLEKVYVFGYSPVTLVNRQAYNVTAIDAQKLHNNTLDIAHILDRVPGARLRESGGVGSDYDFSISGFSGKRIKFFIDGVPMESFGPSLQINNIPINLAERIEIYKGVIPVWLGSDALGGAVNIITNNKMRNYLDASYSYGSFNTHRAYINVGYTSKKGFAVRLNAFQNYSDNNYKMTIDAADIRTGAYVRDTTLSRFHDQYHNKTLIAQVGFVDKKWADYLFAGITLGKYYKQIQTGATTNAVYGAWHEKGDIIMPTVKYKKANLLIDGLNAMFQINYNMGQNQNIDTVHGRYGWLGDSISYRGKGGELWYSYYKYRNHNANATTTLSYKINDKQSIAINNVFTHFNRTGVNVVSPSAIDDIPQKINKNILGVSYQYQLIQKWDATLFGKYYSQKADTKLLDIDYTREQDTLYISSGTNNNRFGYGLATSYYLTPTVQIKLSYEKTNRLPQAEELFGDVVYREGNWDLHPESSDNINIGTRYTVSLNNHLLHVSATGIYRYVRDFIYDGFNAIENKIMAKNLLRVSSVGVESEIRYSYKGLFSTGVNATYQNIRDKARYLKEFNDVLSSTYKERIPNIPYLFGNADATFYFKNIFCNTDKLSVNYNILYVHSFYLYWANQGARESKRTIPKQISHDANIVYTFKDGRYNIGLACHNLTNNKLYDNFSLQKPGRSLNIKCRYFFNK